MRQKIRTRLLLAVEGESEQSFVRWLQALADEKALAIHLDAIILGGGGYKTMLAKAVYQHEKRTRSRGDYCQSFLIVDEDRSESGDWPIEHLREEAAKKSLAVCIQRPNHEGLLYRLMPGCEREFLTASASSTKLRTRWPKYQKPMNARQIQAQFSFEDLIRFAATDKDWKELLKVIGLIE